ncbi:hypothetical protein K505DRAFT_391222 [Melanomma pulvis-pyrius CBS 109.77]|uniref:Uncharacterized protein n=1 Tax=Melanomma pulvis-pyrius CBS 109.77 TaxID=1314802 RepID=A0A6A6XRK5_9PLEO|nr:hypothetical protein K505DRAFT_391222 [Melanomma pulvis-pyrius CBS 109.77]
MFARQRLQAPSFVAACSVTDPSSHPMPLDIQGYEPLCAPARDSATLTPCAIAARPHSVIHLVSQLISTLFDSQGRPHKPTQAHSSPQTTTHSSHTQHVNNHQCQQSSMSTPPWAKTFVKLSGPENYDTWLKDFEPIANMNGYLGLYLGTDEVVGKPAPPDFVPKVTAATSLNVRIRKSADKELASPNPAVPEAPVEQNKDNSLMIVDMLSMT